MQGHQKTIKNKTDNVAGTPSHMVVVHNIQYIGYKYKATTWYYLNGFPNGIKSNLGSTVYCRGEAHRYTACTFIILITMHSGCHQS